jgi:broad specificity phosphatase PhoE
VLVRHAEKAGPVGDVPLTPEGEARAQELARMLGDADISMIYTSQYLRNVEHGQAAGSKARHRADRAARRRRGELVELLRMTTPGTTAVVVSHQDKLVEIVAALGGSTPPIPDQEYDRMVVLTLAGGKTHLLTLRYGAPRSTP